MPICAKLRPASMTALPALAARLRHARARLGLLLARRRARVCGGGGLGAGGGAGLGALAIAALAAPAALAGPASSDLQASPAQAARAACGQREDVVDRLRARFGETRRGYGLQQGEAVVEVFASEDTGSWTIILTMPDGMACLLAAGESWAAPTPAESAAEAAQAGGDPI